MSTFFVIHHRNKPGCEEASEAHSQNKEDYEFCKAEEARWDAAGFHAHDCLIGGDGGTPSGQIFGLWEGQEGKTAADMQAYIDSEMPFLLNVVYAVDASVNDIKPKPFFGAEGTRSGTPHRLNDFPLMGELTGAQASSKLYMIEHFCKPGMVEGWLKMTEGFAPKTEEEVAAFETMMGEFTKKGFHAHTSLPVSKRDGHVFCLWEGKDNTSAADMQAFIDSVCDDGLMVNVCHPICGFRGFTPFFQ